MKTTRLIAFALTTAFAPIVASGQVVVDGTSNTIVLGEFLEKPNAAGGNIWIRPSDGAAFRSGQPLRVKRARPMPVWKIPHGKYGLQIKDGLRMIGRPAKNWSATLKTDFGTVTIPLSKITKLEPAANGQFVAHLKNGDRVTGELISKKLPFETEFGTLSVPSSDLVRLSTASPVKPAALKSTGVRGKTTGLWPPRPAAVPGGFAVPADSPFRR